jgi:hypothetical protein
MDFGTPPDLYSKAGECARQRTERKTGDARERDIRESE